MRPGTGCSGSCLLPGVPGTPVLAACSRRQVDEMCRPVGRREAEIKGISHALLIHVLHSVYG